MSDSEERMWQLFFEVYENLPRQGPGSFDSAQKALGFVKPSDSITEVLDLGCGVGGQTMQLTELLPNSNILAIDSHEPSIAKLASRIRDAGLSKKVMAKTGDIANLDLESDFFDLIWSEGALYNIGLDHALQVCRNLLKPKGWLVFSDAVWLKHGAPEVIKAGFDQDYPDMGYVEDNLQKIDHAGLELVAHFTLPEHAWWDDFYTPMIARIEQLKIIHVGDTQALEVLSQLEQEPALHREFSEFYAYEFFIVRNPG